MGRQRNVRNDDKQSARRTKALREIMAVAKNRENSSGVMELSGAHVIDLERALSFVSFKR